MSIMFSASTAADLIFVGDLPSSYAEVERWDQAEAGQSRFEGISPERRVLRAMARAAVHRARPVASDASTMGDLPDIEYALPPLVVQRRVTTKFRRVAPMVPPTLDEDDLPL